MEVASELAEKYPGGAKSITLVSSTKHLMAHSVDSRLGEIVEDWLVARGVKVIHGDRVEDLGRAPVEAPRGTTYTTKGGKQVVAELVLPCTGQVATTGYAPSGWLVKGGLIKVDPTLQVTGEPAIFAIGDINDTPVLKTAYLGGEQVGHTIANLKALIRGGKASPWGPAVKPGTNIIAVSLGAKAGGIACWPGCCWGSNTCGPTGMFPTFKSKDLMVGMFTDKHKGLWKDGKPNLAASATTLSAAHAHVAAPDHGRL